MAQKDFGTMNPATESGTQLAAHLNDWRDTIHSSHRGAVAPTYAVAGMIWVDDSANPVWVIKLFDGGQWIAIATVNVNDHSNALTASLAAKLNKDASNVGSAAAQAVFRSAIGIENRDYFSRVAPREVAFTRTGVATVSIKAGTIVEVGGEIFTYHNATAIAMPVLAAGDDIAIWIKPDGTPVATLDHINPPVAGARLIGGCHYAPGGNATGFNTGGDSTPQFNPYSLWDLKFRPTAPDPRGMRWDTLGWGTIYGLGVNHHVDGASRYGATLADGASPPKIPLILGGDGVTTYSTFNRWEAMEVLASHGLRLPSYDEFSLLAYGVKEATSVGADPVTAGLDALRTSIWGDMQPTGNMWWWGLDFGGAYGPAAYTANTGGRGSTYMLSNAAVFGGSWGSAAGSGSRASYWSHLPSLSSSSLGARGRCDHLNHE